MAQRPELGSELERGRAIVERWRALAEQRLDYLTSLWESGRWRRFHGEADFLDNLREAQACVETWRLLASREALPDNRPADLGWLGQRAVPLARRDIVTRGDGVAVAIPSPPVAPDVTETPPPARADLDLATMQERYPLLRNAL
ncbi:MAG: TIGR03809 family protein [Xanthobacteraceae bacterium]|nr:TIGR03809 family protein [Xanthobacteraceae bacterium]